MLITLIGYRGTGKTTLARPLAARLGWDWVDADVELEHRAGRSIREIFETAGEPEFRRLERETLQHLLSRSRLVLAAGGGAILNSDTRRDFRSAGPVLWLKASVDTIEARLHGDQTTRERRPNLTPGGGRAEIERVLAHRASLYRECATLEIQTDAPLPGGGSLPTPAELVEWVVARLPAGIRPPV